MSRSQNQILPSLTIAISISRAATRRQRETETRGTDARVSADQSATRMTGKLIPTNTKPHEVVTAVGRDAVVAARRTTVDRATDPRATTQNTRRTRVGFLRRIVCVGAPLPDIA